MRLFRKKTKLEKVLKEVKRKRIKELSDDLDNILFLDFDGVINLDRNNYGTKQYDKVCMNNLNKFCLNYNFKIVVISSWRKYSNYKDLLLNSGLDKRICIKGKTDDLDTFREEEVLKYILDNPYIGKFIILDDGKYNELEKYQIKTNFDTGFDKIKYDEAVKLINNINL